MEPTLEDYRAARKADETYDEVCERMNTLNHQWKQGLLTNEEYLTEMGILVSKTSRP